MLKYIGYYDTQPNCRAMSVAAVNKMNYICEALNAEGIPVEIVSCGMIANEDYAPKREQICENTWVRYFKTFKRSRCRIIRLLQLFCQNVTLLIYILKNVQKDETVLVYHSLGIMNVIRIARKLKRFSLVLETEEIYSDVVMSSAKKRKQELNFISKADAYVFPTKLLHQQVNVHNKPYVIIHGTYKNEYAYNESFGDGKIHVVYAGTFDMRKGVGNAIESARFLDERYHLHILGFGSANEVETVRELVEETNADTKASVSYEGLLTGTDYVRFIQKCDIGLCPQDVEASFNMTSFPSKILSYMSNGLRVVSVKIPAIEESMVGEKLYFYDKQMPKTIAEAILRVDVQSVCLSRENVAQLDAQFKKEIVKLLEGFDVEN